MDRPHHPGDGVGQQHRGAVGGQHGQHHPAVGRDQPVGLAHGRLPLGRPLPEPAGLDPQDGGPVDLAGQGPRVAGEAEDGGDPAAVGQRPAQVVVEPQPEVEGGERRARGAAGPAGEGGDDPGLEQVLGHKDRRPWRFRVARLWRPRPPGQRPLRCQRVSA
jgi:hypothetical protein